MEYYIDRPVSGKGSGLLRGGGSITELVQMVVSVKDRCANLAYSLGGSIKSMVSVFLALVIIYRWLLTGRRALT